MAKHSTSGIDAYVFVRDTEPGQVDALVNLGGEGGVVQRWGAPSVGRFEAFLVLEAESLRDLQGYVVNTLRRAGRVGTEVLVAIHPTPNPLKRMPALEFEAIVRVHVRRGWAHRVKEDVEKAANVLAAVIVTGAADLVVEIAADALESVHAAIGALQDIEGIRHTESVLLADPPQPSVGLGAVYSD